MFDSWSILMGRVTKVASILVAATLGTAVLLGASGSAGARDGVMNAVTEKVRVESRNGKVLVRLTFENDSDRTVYVPRSVAVDKQLLNPWFEVRDSSNGDPIQYTGPMVKRPPLGKDDYLALKPHSIHRNTIDITHAYAFMAGRHTYQLNFAGNYVADVKQVDQLTAVEPDSVMFAFVGK
jgi:hypothetical protein